MYLWVHYFKWAYEDFFKCINQREVYFTFAAPLCVFLSDMVRFGCLFDTGALFSWANALIDLALINTITYSLTHSPCWKTARCRYNTAVRSESIREKKKEEKLDQSIFLQHFSPFVGCAMQQPGITHFSWPALRHTVALQLRTSLQVEHSAAFPKTVGRSGH